MFENWLPGRCARKPSFGLEQLEARLAPTVDLILDFDGGSCQAGQGYECVAGTAGYQYSAFDAFAAADGGPGNRTEQILQIVAGVREDFAPFDVRVIWDDRGTLSPFFDATDTVILITGNDSSSIGGGAYGVAATVDMTEFTGRPDFSTRDTALVFGAEYSNLASGGARLQLRKLINTVSHEAGHTFGISHGSASDSDPRNVLSYGNQNLNLDSRFSSVPVEREAPEDGAVYSEVGRLTESVGLGTGLSDTHTALVLPLDTPLVSFAGDTATAAGTLEFLGDRDAFRFVAPVTGSLTVELSAVSAAFDPVVTIWNAAGDFVASSAANGSGVAIFDVVAGATYYAIAGSALDRQPGPLGGNGTGSYSLSIAPSSETAPVLAPPAGSSSLAAPGAAATPPAGIPPAADAMLQIVNQQVIAALRQIFARPLSTPIVAAAITSVGDQDGDGYDDVSVIIVFRTGRGPYMAFTGTLNGLTAAVIGTPIIARL